MSATRALDARARARAWTERADTRAIEDATHDDDALEHERSLARRAAANTALRRVVGQPDAAPVDPAYQSWWYAEARVAKLLPRGEPERGVARAPRAREFRDAFPSERVAYLLGAADHGVPRVPFRKVAGLHRALTRHWHDGVRELAAAAKRRRAGAGGGCDTAPPVPRAVAELIAARPLGIAREVAALLGRPVTDALQFGDWVLDLVRDGKFRPPPRPHPKRGAPASTERWRG